MHFTDNLNEETVSQDVKALIRRIDVLSTMVYAQWLVLQQKGFTHEELDMAIATALENEKREDYAPKGMCCPNCGKVAQVSGSYKIKCIYCGSEAIINPYELVDMAIAQDAAMCEQPRPDVRPANPVSVDRYASYAPYDVSQDLSFDDLM